MSSPPSGSSNVPLVLRGRKIAPLPRRFRGSSNPGSSQNVLSTNEALSANSSSETNQSLPTTSSISIRRHSYQTPDTTENARHLSPPAPEEIHLSSSQDSSMGLNDPSLPTLSTRNYEISQFFHALYSDKKTALSAAGGPLERGLPRIVGDHPDTAAGTHYASPFRPTTPLSLNQVPNLSPSLNVLRPRSVSDISDVSDNNDNTEPYDVQDEEAPLEPFFTSSFQTALKNGLGIASKLDTAIEKLVGSSEPSSDLERLLKDARRLGTFQSSDTRTIAVLGDSGEGNCCILRGITTVSNMLVGKSSLINALLHFPEIAKTVR